MLITEPRKKNGLSISLCSSEPSIRDSPFRRSASMRVTSKNTGSDYLNTARKGGHHKGWFLGASPFIRQVSFTWSKNKGGRAPPWIHHCFGSLLASSPFGGYREKYTREMRRVLARLGLLVQIGELALGLYLFVSCFHVNSCSFCNQCIAGAIS